MYLEENRAHNEEEIQFQWWVKLQVQDGGVGRLGVAADQNVRPD